MYLSCIKNKLCIDVFRYNATILGKASNFLESLLLFGIVEIQILQVNIKNEKYVNKELHLRIILYYNMS